MDTKERTEEGTVFDGLWREYVLQFLDEGETTEEERSTVRTVFYAGMLALLLRIVGEKSGDKSNLLRMMVRLCEEVPRITPVLREGVRRFDDERSN